MASRPRMRPDDGRAIPTFMRPVPRAQPQDDPTVRPPDITLARQELGWEPTVPLDEGLKTTI